MIRIEVSAAADAAIVDTLGGGAIEDLQRSPSGGYSLIVEPCWLHGLTAQRQPGERLSDVILRLVATEADRRPEADPRSDEDSDAHQCAPRWCSAMVNTV